MTAMQRLLPLLHFLHGNMSQQGDAVPLLHRTQPSVSARPTDTPVYVEGCLFCAVIGDVCYTDVPHCSEVNVQR